MALINWYFHFVSQSNHNRNITHNKLFRITTDGITAPWYAWWKRFCRLFGWLRENNSSSGWSAAVWGGGRSVGGLLWIYWWSSWQDGKSCLQYSINDRWGGININEFLICFVCVRRTANGNLIHIRSGGRRRKLSRWGFPSIISLSCNAAICEDFPDSYFELSTEFRVGGQGAFRLVFAIIFDFNFITCEWKLRLYDCSGKRFFEINFFYSFAHSTEEKTKTYPGLNETRKKS